MLLIQLVVFALFFNGILQVVFFQLFLQEIHYFIGMYMGKGYSSLLTLKLGTYFLSLLYLVL